MNELGLERKYIRGLVDEIVTREVDKHMSHLEKSGRLDRIIDASFSRTYRDPEHGYRNFKDLVVSAAAAKASEFISESLTFVPRSGNTPPPPPWKKDNES